MIKENGLYILSDDYFRIYGKPNMMDNKNETRPYYYAVKQKDGIIWLVPLSSKVEKYRLSIQEDEEKRGKGNCIFHYIASVRRRESAFLIGDAIPVIEKYIVRPFTINEVPFVMANQKDIKAIRKRMAKYIALVRGGKLKPYFDIMGIEAALRAELAGESCES